MSPERLRLVQLIPVLSVGGLERVATTLTLELAPQVERIVVCTAGGKAFEQDLRDAGIPIAPVERPSPRRPDRFIRAVIELARVIRRERPHVLHAHNPAAAVAAALARALARRRELAIVSTYHGLAGTKVGLAMWALELSSDVVVGVSPTATQALRARVTRPVLTVVNGVSPSGASAVVDVRREFDAEGAELVVTVGRYSSEKNQSLFLEAIAELGPRRPRLRCLVVGRGPLEVQLRDLATALGISDRVELTGPRLDAVEIMAAADVFVLTSLREGLGLVLIEAMLAGCPVVATEVGGVVDVVTHEQTGLLVPSGDARAVAQAIERLLEDRPLRSRLAARAREEASEKFSVEAMTAGYEEAYRLALEQRRAKVRRPRPAAGA